MGTWDTTSFGNDLALDMLGDFVEGPSLGYLSDALHAALVSRPNELVGQRALAAGEIVAWLAGAPSSDADPPYAEEVAELARAFDVQPLLSVAVRALDHVAGEPSELYQIWEGDPEWLASVADLRRRLQALAAAHRALGS